MPILLSVKDENGALALAKLTRHYNASLESMQGAALSDLTQMATHAARNSDETRIMLIEYATKVKFVEEISRESLGKLHKKSVLPGIMDDETRKRTTEYHGANTSDETLYKDILQFVYNSKAPPTSVPSAHVPMQISAVQNAWGKNNEKLNTEDHNENGVEEWPEEQCWECWDDGTWSGDINALKGGKKGAGNQGRV